MIDTERMRAEQSEVEARQAESRKADMVRLADQFEQAVGEIVNTVSCGVAPARGVRRDAHIEPRRVRRTCPPRSPLHRRKPRPM